jgi:hypothetical protein
MVVIFDSVCQRIETLALILWVDSNSFATSLLEKIFKQEEIPFYGLNSASDFLYLIEDLRPSFLVLDAQTALNHLDAFRCQFEKSELLRKIPIILIDQKPGLEFISNIAGRLHRPYDPYTIPAFIRALNPPKSC